MSGGSSPAGGGAGIRCGRGADSDTRTSGSARTRGRNLGIASQRHAMTPQPACSRSPPRPPTHHHSGAAVGNPDASRSFAARDSGRHALHGSCDRGGSPGSVGRQRAGRGVAPLAHSRPHSRSGRDRSNCRSAPEPGSARTKTGAGPSTAPRAVPSMDASGNGWNTAPAFVLGTMWGTVSIRTWRLGRRRARQSGRLSPRQCALSTPRSACGARRPVDMWTTQERCPTYPQVQQQQPASIDDVGATGITGRACASQTLTRRSTATSSPRRCAILARIQAAVHTGRSVATD
jgi:hypothetical protein